jgi:phosphoglycolate phosphatase-like HAD superfamily hydrolase
MSNSDGHFSRIKQVRAILFDLHHTITKTSMGVLDLHREAAQAAGFNVTNFKEEKIHEVQQVMIEFLENFQIENSVGIHWGEKAEDWLEGNRVFVEALGFKDVPDAQLMDMEKHWKETLETRWESLVEGAKETLEELKKRGYILGICTRRFDNPEQLLKDWEILHLFSTVQYTAVHGYAKPSPFTLLKAADDIGVNPRLCAYVGNLVDADVEASIRAEMLPVLTVWADSEEKEQAPEGTMVIESLGELLDHFKGPPT